MTISKKALRDFVKRVDSLDDFYYLKKEPLDALREAVNDVCPEQLLHNRESLYSQQYACLLISMAVPGFLFYLDMGLGKTQLMLSRTAYELEVGTADTARTLLLCPRNVTVENLCDEISEHSNLSYVPVLGTAEEKAETLFNTDYTVYVMTYPGLTAFCTEKGTNSKGKPVKVIDKKQVRAIAKRFGIVHMDESHKLKNHTTLIFRICRQLVKAIPYAYGYSGTPSGKNPEDFWSQFYLIDGGETLGKTIGLFRAAMLEKRDHFWKGKEYTLQKKDNIKTFQRALRNRSIVYTEDECFDVPKIKRLKRKTKATNEEFKREYNAIVKTIRKTKQVDVSLFEKLRELTSGFLRVSKRSVVDLYPIEENPKICLLFDVLEEMPERKVIVFHEFTHSAKLIQKALEKIDGRKNAAYINGTNAKNHSAELARFKTDPECTTLVVSNACGAESLNLQISNTIIYFETSVSPIVRKQSEKRVRPRTHKKPVTLIDLIVRGSVDERVLECLKDGEDMFNIVKNSGGVEIGKI